jgi:hypothetical protein
VITRSVEVPTACETGDNVGVGTSSASRVGGTTEPRSITEPSSVTGGAVGCGGAAGGSHWHEAHTQPVGSAGTEGAFTGWQHDDLPDPLEQQLFADAGQQDVRSSAAAGATGAVRGAHRQARTCVGSVPTAVAAISSRQKKERTDSMRASYAGGTANVNAEVQFASSVGSGRESASRTAASISCGRYGLLSNPSEPSSSVTSSAE